MVYRKTLQTAQKLPTVELHTFEYIHLDYIQLEHSGTNDYNLFRLEISKSLSLILNVCDERQLVNTSA